MIRFQWFREGQLISLYPHLCFDLNHEGEGFRFIEFYEGGYESSYSLDFDYLVSKIEKHLGKTNLNDFKEELINQYVARKI